MPSVKGSVFLSLLCLLSFSKGFLKPRTFTRSLLLGFWTLPYLFGIPPYTLASWLGKPSFKLLLYPSLLLHHCLWWTASHGGQCSNLLCSTHPFVGFVVHCIPAERRWQICVFAISSLFPPRFLTQWSSQVSLLSPTNVTFRERSRICRKKSICFGQKSFRICPKTSCR